MSHEGNGPTGQEPQDRKSLLLEQFTDAEQAAPPPEVSQPVEAQPAPPQDRPRDETGKFVPKQSAAPAALQPQTPPPTPEAPAMPEPWAKAPASWKKELREKWNSLDPEYQRYVHEREQQMRAGVEPLLPKAELADKINKAAEPYMDTIRGLGLELPQAVAGLMKIDHDLRTLPHDQKVALLVQTARGYGVDLTGQAQNATPTYDPAFGSIQNELLQIKGQFQNFTQQQQAAQERAAQDEIERFTKTAEHFQDVEDTMTKLLQSGLVQGVSMTERLQNAYDQSIRLHPEIFDQIQSAKQAAADAEKRKAADEAAKRAKAAAVSPKSATPGNQRPNNAQDRRSMLIEQINGLSERL